MSELSHKRDHQTDDFLSRPLIESINFDLEKTIYLIIILVAIVTRFWGIGDRVVSHDESLHTQYSYQYYNGDGYQHTPLMHGPSLFHVTAFSYWLFGDNDASARIPVALLGIILVILPYFLRDWLGKSGAIIASILLLISPYITYYSRYIRHDIYIIVAAGILFIAILYFLRERKDKYIWWFAVALGLMFTTMETSYIYVAIFGSFLVISLVAKVLSAPWFREKWSGIRLPLLVIIVALVLFGVGFLGQHFIIDSLTGDGLSTEEATDAGFAADPGADISEGVEAETIQGPNVLFRGLQIFGLITLSAGLFVTANRLRPFIDEYPEFDLVVLFTTLTLPTATAFLVVIAGGDPLGYSLNVCQIAGQETLSPAQLFFARLFDNTCRSTILTKDVLYSAGFLILTLTVSVLVGLWWNRRRWIIAALIFHGIFLFLFTSMFTNPSGWASGMLGSLGYWLKQQEVQRANQPVGFYFFVLTLYEFLPLLLSLLAARLWAKKNQLQSIVDYWAIFIVIALLAYSLTNWMFSGQAIDFETANRLPGAIIGLVIMAAALIYWLIVRQKQIFDKLGLTGGWKELIDVKSLFGFIPYLIWWSIVTWIIYSLAGEKMAWLSSHFILPMVFLGGWYVNEKLITANMGEIKTRRFLLLVGLSGLTLLAIGLVVAAIFRGQIHLGSQELTALSNIGRFIGSLILAGIFFYFVRQVGRGFERGTRGRAWLFAFLILLAFLTVRFTYMSSFKNADYVTEYLVYAHGAPATKSEVLAQLNDLSMRLHGDKSIKVAFDNDSSWPFTWYLRDYPNRIYFGENPGRNITEAPVIIVGSQNWSKVEPIVGDDYEERTYTFLWWPMEEYRKLSWNAILGDPNVEPELRRGLGNPEVRQAIWDIFFYRDYEKYGSVFGGNYEMGQWPLRHDLRMYIQKDTLAALWDHGIDAIAAEPPVDIYAENNLDLLPTLVIGSQGSGEGQLLQPRNVAVSPDGMIFVADSGNHRIQVFDQAGNFVNVWGGFGAEPGLFNEPWGIAADEEFVYVADTWNHRVQKFNHDGELIDIIGQSGTPADGQIGGGLFFGPRAITILDNGNLLVTDTGNHRIQMFDTEGQFIRAMGSQGTLPGQFYEPVGLDVAEDGMIYVADTWNGRIQHFGQDLLPLNEWKVDAWYGESINNKPYLASDSRGRIYVSDPEGYRILIFADDGQYVGRFGQFSSEIDGFGLPVGVATDADGKIYVADAGNSRILVFDPSAATNVGRFIQE